MEERLEKVLMLAEEHDVTLSRSETQFGQKVHFGGFVVESKDGQYPQAASCLAISETSKLLQTSRK